ncbi:hypothetical protein BGZ96_010056 [Linnemannia gamsii]|uniref:NACHT domain-containing protein n=1 Tax=Linnemannia gamsii TaxID=64522 RepID=A0ABQ7JWW6_9FUNG|nr:hypothetical protein BGZ96_010056 [Linnemannia gamsii]
MASSTSKRLVSDALGGDDPDIDQPARKREDHRNRTILDDHLTLLPVLASNGLTDLATYGAENTLKALKVRRLEEYRQPVYIPPMAKASLQAKGEDFFPLMAKVQEFLDSERQVMLILGDSGAGKSTFNRHLERLLWINYKKDNSIPLFINLPDIERPDQDMITKQLQAHEFSEDQILEMKMHQHFILICDGYDESQLTSNLHKTNRLNQRDQWRTKMIISCRTQFLGAVYLDRFAPQLMDRYTKARSDLFQEAVIAPFSTKQVEDYVAQYVPLKPRPWVTEDYMLMLSKIPNLMDMVKNPFLLTLTLEALPGVTKSQQELSDISISRVQLYDHFVNEWLNVNMRRLRESSLTHDEREMLEHMIEKGFILLGVDFSKRLALAIFEKHYGNPVIQYLHYDHKNSWRADFFGPQLEVRFLRESSPLTRTGSLYRFIHRSMLEYFFSRAIFDPSTHGVSDEFAPKSNLGSCDVQPLDPNGPLFTRDLIKEPSIIQFLCERLKQNSDFGKQLRDVVELSKTDTNTATAAANAITILVRAGTLFHGADLRGIRIPGADLSGGQFDSAQLQGADLRGVNLTRSWLRQANLTHTQLEGVRFGELPYLEEENMVIACAYSPDGTKFVTVTGIGCSGIINVYSVSTWARMNTVFSGLLLFDYLTTNTAEISINSIAFSPDSRHFVTGSDDGTVRLWDCAEGRKLLDMRGDYVGYVSVAFSPCGKRVASACTYGNARVWSTETGETVFAMKDHAGYIKSVKYSPDGSQVVLGRSDGTIRFWDAATGEEGAIWNAPSGDAVCLAYAPDGRQLASGHYGGVVQLWDTLSGEPGVVLRGNRALATGIEFSPDGRWVAISSDDSIVRLFDVGDGALISTFHGHTDSVLDLAFSPDGRQLASAGRDNIVRLWDVDSSEASVGWQEPNDVGLDALFTVDGYLILSGGESGESVRLWNPLTGAGRPSIPLSSRWINAGAISPNGRHVTLGGSNGSLRMWDCQTGEAGPIVDGHGEYIGEIFYSPCGRWVLSTSPAKARVWDLQSPERTQTIGRHKPGFMENYVCAAFSPTTMMEYKIAVTDWTRRLELYDPRTGDLLKEIWLGDHAKPISLAFSPNGRQLAIGTENNSIEFWNHESEEVPSIRLQGHGGWVLCVAYSSCGQWLASGNSDRTVQIWRRSQQQQLPEGSSGVESWSCVTILRGFFEIVQGISWNPYGPLEIVTKSSDKAVRIWRISVDGDTDSGGVRGGVTVHLVWGSNLGRLCAEGLRFEGAMGLDLVYKKLLLQRGAERRSR